MPDVRTTPCIESPQIFDTQAPFSNFSFIEKYFGRVMTEPIKRIFSQARMSGYKTLVMEKTNNVGFSKDDDNDLDKAGIKGAPGYLIRLSFFTASFKSAEDLKNQEDSSFLGYAVVKEIPWDSKTRWIVFESVTVHSRHDNNFLHGERDYTVNICGKFFSIRGNLYCQQNGLTNVCAHVALRTCISLVNPSGDFSYHSMNKILEDVGYPHGIRQPLEAKQILAILDNQKIPYSMQVYDPKGPSPQIPYQSFLYGSVESGYPALLGFSLDDGSGHIIPILGHTFNADTWVPNAETSYFRIGKDTQYVQSESWVSTYICHDDNFGSYYCLPRQYISSKNPVLVIAFRPFQAQYDAIDAEAIAADCLYTLVPKIKEESSKKDWARRLYDAITTKMGWFVLRTIHMSAKKYIEHVGTLRGWDSKTVPVKLLSALGEMLKGNLWVVEISLPELFPANRRKLGEIILNPLSTGKDLSCFLFARILDKIYFFAPDSSSKLSLISYDAGIDTHTELYPENRSIV